jgi:pre-rRNA-processing protein IPI1
MTQISTVSEYIIKLLRGKDTSIGQVPRSLPAEAYLALLPSIWAIINKPYPELSSHSNDLLQALLDHAIKTSSKSSAKRLTIQFVAQLMLVSPPIARRRFHEPIQ